MRKIVAYRFKVYDINSDALITSRRYGTREAIRTVAGGAVIEGSEIEIDASQLDNEMPGFTPIGFRLSRGGGFQAVVKMTLDP